MTTNTNNTTDSRHAGDTSRYITDKTGRTWKRVTFGDLKEGDYIPDENGNPTRVTACYPTHTPQTMIEFTTPTGTFTVGGTHLLYVETGEDIALHAHRLHAARETLAPLTGNPGVKATLETIAHHGNTATATGATISAAHALSRLPVTPVKTARSIHAQTIHATKSLTQPRHAAAETSRLARNQLLSSRLRLTPRPVMRRIRTKRTLTLPRTTLPRLTLTIHMPLHSHNRPHPSRKNTANKTPLAAAPPENKPETRGKQKSGGGNPSPTTRQ